LSAVARAPDKLERREGIVVESRLVMERLEETLQQLGCSFDDVVKMNSWYFGPASKDDWEPSARAVAGFYREPGPVATAIPLAFPFDDGALIRIELMAMRNEDGRALERVHSWPDHHWDWPIHLPYQHGLLCDGLAFVGGQVSLDSHAEVIDPGNFEKQVKRSLNNIDLVLRELGLSNRDLLRIGVFYEVGDNRERTLSELLPPTCRIFGLPLPTSPIETCWWKSKQSLDGGDLDN